MSNAVTQIECFYRAFQARDPDGMAACYHPEVHFSDEVFPDLHGPQVTAMWRMLMARNAALALTFDRVQADADGGSAHWVATYPFSKTGRLVVNDVQARFVFQDGLIVRHVDRFDFWRWSRMALGAPGLLLGWTGYLRAKVRHEAAENLARFQNERPT